MSCPTGEKTDQSSKKNDTRNAYVRNWREKRRVVKRKAIFVHEYVQAKRGEIYAEAMKFYDELDQTYPEKIDLCKTAEFKLWRAKTTKAPTQQTATPVLNIQPSSHQSSPAEIQPSTPPEIGAEITVETPPEIGAETTVETPPEIGAETTVETPLETDEINDERIQEILSELREDPDLERIFNNLDHIFHNDEGIELDNEDFSGW